MHHAASPTDEQSMRLLRELCPYHLLRPALEPKLDRPELEPKLEPPELELLDPELPELLLELEPPKLNEEPLDELRDQSCSSRSRSFRYSTSARAREAALLALFRASSARRAASA